MSMREQHFNPFIFNKQPLTPIWRDLAIMAEDETEKPKFPREYERVPGLDEIDRNDPVALVKARHQWTRDRQVLFTSS